jgi:hypothetical protein
MWLFEQLVGLLMFVIMLAVAALGLLLVVGFFLGSANAGGVVEEQRDLSPVILGSDHPWFLYQMENDDSDRMSPLVEIERAAPAPTPTPMQPVGHPPQMVGRD